MRRSWIDDKRHLRYRINSKIKKQQRWNEAKKFETMIRSINKKFWIIEKLNVNRAHNCWILLTDERMNCHCCLFKMNEKFSLLYKKSLSFIYLLILHFLIHRDSFEDRDLRLSRRFFLLIKLSSFLVVTSIWFHQNRIFIFEFINFSTISKINKSEKNHLDCDEKSTIRIVSNKQMRFKLESFMHEKSNDDVMK